MEGLEYVLRRRTVFILRWEGLMKCRQLKGCVLVAVPYRRNWCRGRRPRDYLP